MGWHPIAIADISHCNLAEKVVFRWYDSFLCCTTFPFCHTQTFVIESMYPNMSAFYASIASIHLIGSKAMIGAIDVAAAYNVAEKKNQESLWAHCNNYV